MITKLKEEFIRTIPGCYINADGYWESRDSLGDRGSGIEDTFRLATDDEKRTLETFGVVEKFTKDRDK